MGNLQAACYVFNQVTQTWHMGRRCVSVFLSMMMMVPPTSWCTFSSVNSQDCLLSWKTTFLTQQNPRGCEKPPCKARPCSKCEHIPASMFWHFVVARFSWDGPSHYKLWPWDNHTTSCFPLLSVRFHIEGKLILFRRKMSGIVQRLIAFF